MKPRLLLLVTFALAACDRFGAPPKFARENNPDRKKHSVPIIDSFGRDQHDLPIRR